MGEKNYQKLDKNAVKCMRINAIITGFIVLVAELITVVAVGRDKMPFWCWIGLGILALLTLIYIIVSPNIRYERYLYSIDEDAIRVREGFLWISYSLVPIERLHKIELSQGPVARLFKFYTVKVTTAGGEVDIKFIREDIANEIAEHLKDVINKLMEDKRLAESRVQA